MKRSIGVCYYPEHWDEKLWENDAKKMLEAGISWVRIGEFAWKRIEPSEGEFNFDWLDKVINILGSVGLKVILGTPTATPPKWVVKKYPDMLALDKGGNVRKFGSRRHYCFSHKGYVDQCLDIVERLAKRYSENPYLSAWQIDNEYGCHDTVLSFSHSACMGFRDWLRDQFPGEGNDGDIKKLNKAWGNVFWSMEYDSFDEIELPNQTVTEPNPAHLIFFKRYFSDCIVAFNKFQVDMIRKYSDLPVTHNFMGRTTDFDHFKVSKDLDIASWDSYPLGFLEDRIQSSKKEKRLFSQQGHPDFQAFHHDLYRAVGKDRLWIMEQQPGPVNWAPFNPAPLDGMVRLWTWEAFAHGAENVCYFRWRQVPFAQEQMHSGIFRPDNEPAPALKEVKKVASELKDSKFVKITKSSVAIIFDYDADAMWDIQPQGEGLCYFNLIFEIYCSLRRLGLSIDFISPNANDLSGYKLIIASGMMHLPKKLKDCLENSDAQVIYGPRSGAKDKNMSIPLPLPPNINKLDVLVEYVQTLRPDILIPLEGKGSVINYFEQVKGKSKDILKTDKGLSVAKCSERITYLAAWLDGDGFDLFFKDICSKCKIETIAMPFGVRRRQNSEEEFWFNYNAFEVDTIHGKILPADFLKI